MCVCVGGGGEAGDGGWLAQRTHTYVELKHLTLFS